MHLKIFFLSVSLTVPLIVSVTLSKHPVILIVSFDGFRYDFLTETNTPLLFSLKKSGVSVPFIIPPFPAETLPTHHSIATGLYIESHGVIGNKCFDPKYNETLTDVNNTFWNYHPEVLPLWIHNEMAGDGRVSGCYMWPGSFTPYGKDNDKRPTYYISKYNSEVSWGDRVHTVISWMTNATAPANLVFLYYHELDIQGHQYGPNSEKYLNEIKNTDGRVQYLVDKLKTAEIFYKINLIILSDHGMQSMNKQGVFNITKLIDPSLVEGKMPNDSTILHFTPKKGREDELYGNIHSNMSGVAFNVWRKEELHKYHYSDSRRIGDIVVIAQPGYAFKKFRSRIKNFTEIDPTEYGMHGYSNDVPSTRGIFLACGPALKEGEELQPISSVDVVPLVSTILGIEGIPYNGSLSRVEGMIKIGYLPKLKI